MQNRDFLSTDTMLLASLTESDARYTPIDARFDRLVRVAREALSVQVAGITLLQQGGFWFKSIAGWEVTELSADHSLCTLVVTRQELVIVDDLLAEAALAKHPLVTSAPHFRFYAGYPLLNASGQLFGTLCFYDLRPRHLNSGQMQVLRDLGEMTQRELTTSEVEGVQRTLVAKLDLARRQALIDPLTRVWNRRAGLELLAQACHAPATGSRAVCMVDLDWFKQVNDRFGHQTGDDVLKGVAGIIVSSIREGDIVIRYGGDEFLLIVNLSGTEELHIITERITGRIAEFPIATRSGDIPVTATIGATLIDDSGSTPEALIELADQALLNNKAARTYGTVERSGKASEQSRHGRARTRTR